jgi:hypothetical protein
VVDYGRQRGATRARAIPLADVAPVSRRSHTGTPRAQFNPSTCKNDATWRAWGCGEGVLRTLARPQGTSNNLGADRPRSNIAPRFFNEHRRVMIRWQPRGSTTWQWITFTSSAYLFNNTDLFGDFQLTNVESSVAALQTALAGGAKWCQAFRVS